MSATIQQPAITTKENATTNNQRYGIQGKNILESKSVIAARSVIHLGRKNLITNGDFDIWQRGTSLSSSGLEYIADRWIHNPSGGNMTTSRQTFVVGQTEVPDNPKYYMRFAATVADNNMGPGQAIENIRLFDDVDITTTFWARSSGTALGTLRVSLQQQFGSGGSPIATVNAPNIKLTNTWTKYTTTLHLPKISDATVGTNHHIRLFINNPLTETFTADIAHVQMEYGRQSTEFEQRLLSDELRLCQRYYQKTYNMDDGPGTTTALGRITDITEQNVAGENIGAIFVQRMASAPTVTLYASVTGTSGSVSNNGDKVASAQLISESGFSRISVTGGVTTNFLGYHYTADAEIV